MIKSHFYKSYKLNKEKYSELYNYALKVREHKNLVSKSIYGLYLEDIYNGSLRVKQML